MRFIGSNSARVSDIRVSVEKWMKVQIILDLHQRKREPITMSKTPDIEVRAKLILTILGTRIPVVSFSAAIEQLQNQSGVLGNAQKLLVEADPPISYLVAADSVKDAAIDIPDATLSADGWSLLVDGVKKLTLPSSTPLVKRAMVLAEHHGADHITLNSLTGTQCLDLGQKEPVAPTAVPHSGPVKDPADLPPVCPAEEPVPLPEPMPQTSDAEGSTEAEEETIAAVHAVPEDTVSYEQPTFHQGPAYGEPLDDQIMDSLVDDEEVILAGPPRTGRGFNSGPTQRPVARRALLVGMGGTLVLGVGAFAASKFLSTPAPKTPAPVVTSTTQPAAPAAPVPGVEATALRQFPMAYSDLAISADGQYLALQVSDTEVTIHRTTSTEETPDSGTSDGQVLSFEGKLVPPILPLDAQYGPGFILRIADSSGALGAPSTLIVWTPKKGTTKHELSVGSQLTSRGGHSWIGSTIPTTGPRTIKEITAEKLETYIAPSFGPALFALLDKGSALWASIESDNTASVLAANAKGKISTTGVLKRPSKSAVVSKWVSATADHALMLWKAPDGYSLALHRTRNGDIAGKTKFKLPADTTPERLQARTSFDGNTVILGHTWANLKTGAFGAPTGVDASAVQTVPRFGGMELTSGSETQFRTDSGSTFPVPNQGTVLAATKDVVILEESRLVSVYRKTTTEGTK